MKKARLAKEAAAKAKKLAAKKGKKGKSKKTKKSLTMKSIPLNLLQTATAVSAQLKDEKLGELETGIESPSVAIKVDGVEVDKT